MKTKSYILALAILAVVLAMSGVSSASTAADKRAQIQIEGTEGGPSGMPHFGTAADKRSQVDLLDITSRALESPEAPRHLSPYAREKGQGGCWYGKSQVCFQNR